MSLRGTILGRPLASWEQAKQELSVTTGVPVLGLDALASTGYGPEAALAILATLGVAGLRYFPVIMLAVVVTLGALYLSYRQTIATYPNGGGAYIVATDNLGTHAGLLAAVALLMDYLLNVAVGIASGVAAVISAFPALQPYTLTICLFVLFTLTLVNLRGVRESGLAFIVPAVVFTGCIAVTILLGLLRAWQSGGQPVPVEAPPAIPEAAMTLSVWLLLAAFANGCTAMTGVEAVSNGVPFFREPAVPSAQRTLTIIVVILGLFLLGLGYLCPAYRIGAMDQEQPGYQTILSQLVEAVAGRGLFYYLAISSIFVILTYSAQTSFAAFPVVCRQLAEDGYLPSAFADRGRRLVFSFGIIVLAILSGLLLITFGGVTQKLIPLFAVGAFSAFLLSQVGMVFHWRGKSGHGDRIKLVFNGIGAVVTGIALATIIVAKFVDGAWMVIVVVPPFVLLLQGIKEHYKRISREVGWKIQLKASKLQPPIVIVPIDTWNRLAERALRFGLLLSDDVTAVHTSTGEDDAEGLRKIWTEKVEKPSEAANCPTARLEIVWSPYRRIHQPILDFVDKAQKENPGRLIAVVIPELVEPHWYEYLLHSLNAVRLKALLFLERNRRVVVISVPWYVREETDDRK